MVASGRLNRMMNGVISELKVEDHHHVDEQDGHAHRGEQAAERLGLLLADAGELDGDADRDAAVGLERVDRRLDGRRHGAGVLAR